MLFNPRTGHDFRDFRSNYIHISIITIITITYTPQANKNTVSSVRAILLFEVMRHRPGIGHGHGSQN